MFCGPETVDVSRGEVETNFMLKYVKYFINFVKGATYQLLSSFEGINSYITR